MVGKCGTILSMGREQEVKCEAVELLGSGRRGMETPRNGYPMAGVVIQSLSAQQGARTLGQTQLLQGLQLWENR